MAVTRFAPTTSGRAHPGTLLSAALAWLDAQTSNSRFILRMEDIDPSGVKPEFRSGLLDDLHWFGLEWDELIWQSACRPAHETLLDRLAATGRLYACSCTRSLIAKAGIPSLAGGWVYPGTCRGQKITDWRNCISAIRINLSDQSISVQDESGIDLSQTIADSAGDPVLRRADGSFTYMLAVVADDHTAKVSRIVRGRDIASSTATQIALYRLAGWAEPSYRHHLLLLESRDQKLAKLHGSIGAPTLRTRYEPAELLGILAHSCGILSAYRPITFQELVGEFSWPKVLTTDYQLSWDGKDLTAVY